MKLIIGYWSYNKMGEGLTGNWKIEWFYWFFGWWVKGENLYFNENSTGEEGSIRKDESR